MGTLEDLRAYSKGSKAKMLSTAFLNPCFHAVQLYRLSRLFYRIKLGVIARLIKYLNRVVYSVDIDFRADLAGGFELIHGIGVVIGCDVITKGRVKIYQGVTLGGNSGKTKTWLGQVISQPLLYENTTIYAGASILGPVVVHKGSVVGAHSVVTCDIEEGTLFYTKVQKVVQNIT